MTVIGVPVGLSKLKIKKKKKIWAYFMAQKRSGARILHHKQFPKSPQLCHSLNQQGNRKKCRAGERKG